MDSSAVSEEFKAKIGPILKLSGFTRFQTRRAWRIQAHTIEVLSVRSFRPDMALSFGCTPYSFSVECGVYYPSIHGLTQPPTPLPELPKESACQARCRLLKSLSQPELARRDIWYVREDGSNLEEVLGDCRKAIGEQGLPWLTGYSDLEKAWKAFKERPESEYESFQGVVGSPGRDLVLRGIRSVLDTLRDGRARGLEQA